MLYRVFVVVKVSVRFSVRLSVTLLYCFKITLGRITKSLLWAATNTLVLGSIKLFQKFEKLS